MRKFTKPTIPPAKSQVKEEQHEEIELTEEDEKALDEAWKQISPKKAE